MLQRVAAAVQRTVLTVYYFFYFLLKGKPEWQCERVKEKERERLLQKNCCVDCRPNCEEHGGANGQASSYNGYYNTAPAAYGQGKGAAATVKGWFSTAWSYIKSGCSTVWNFIKRVGRAIWHYVCVFFRWIRDFFASIWPTLKKVFLTSPPAHAMPDVPYESSNTYRPVHFEENEKSLSEEPSFKDVIQPASRLPPIPIPPPRPITPTVKLSSAEVPEESLPAQPIDNYNTVPSSFTADSFPTKPAHPLLNETFIQDDGSNFSSKQDYGISDSSRNESNSTMASTRDSVRELAREAAKTPVHMTYIQEPTHPIDLSQYTTRIGGVGPSHRVEEETTTSTDDSTLSRRGREKSVGPPIEGGFYAQRTYSQPPEREGSAPPPPPPPPPTKPVRIPSAMERESTPTRPAVDNKKETAIKGAIPMLPLSVLEQMSSGANEFRERTERGRSATVSERVREANSKTPVNFERIDKKPVRGGFHRSKTTYPDHHYQSHNQNYSTLDSNSTMDRSDIYQNGESGGPPHGWRPVSAFEPDRSGASTPWRATSVGPSLYRGVNTDTRQNVVSRVDSSTAEEPQYIFRAKQPYSTAVPSDAYLMGRSVYTPIQEVENMRDHVNRRSMSVMSVSRPVTPAASYAGRPITPYQESLSRTTTPANHFVDSDEGVRRRSRTVGPYSRESTAFSDITTGQVNNRIRAWPPVSNVTPMDIVKDNWFHNAIQNGDDGLVTTKIKRVSEKKVEDNWRWRDQDGKLLDEKTERSWRGDTDHVVRDGPGQGRQFSRTVEVMPSGDTRFQDVNRQYNNNFVVESICRNY